MDAKAVSDTEIVHQAFLKWEAGCFARFTGDWALALWCEVKQQLYLARDHAGSRTLYYAKEKNEILWSTYLDAFVLAGTDRGLSADFAARYLALAPLREFTPYEGIHAVLPGQYLIFADDNVSAHKHWSALISGTIQYQSDVDYEEHFLTLFRQSVARRTGAGAPILAQLSGGMDSTSIVCMSDHIRRSKDRDAEILDTISYFDDSEASFDEKAYFSITESRRGKVGAHVEIGFAQTIFEQHDENHGTYLWPGADSLTFQKERSFHHDLWTLGYRSILSGVGGDEVLGGNPIGLAELADDLLFCRWRRLIRQALAWSLVDRTPVLFTLAKSAAYVCDALFSPDLPQPRTPPWITRALKEHISHSNKKCSPPLFSRYAAPSRLDNARSWWTIMEALPHRFPQILNRLEYRYPYLDKDLVEYLFRIPRAQILRPGRRRSLMRRALVNIVPVEILERRRKAFQLRAPLSALRAAEPALHDLFARNSQLQGHGFVDVEKLRSSLSRTAQGETSEWQSVMRAITLELWMRGAVPVYAKSRDHETHAMRMSSTVR